MPSLPKLKRDTAKLIAAKEPSHERKLFTVELDCALAQSLNADTGVNPARQALERIISEKYHSAHSAHITEFMPILLGMSLGGRSHAALGLRPGHYRPMFLEQYMDAPIEQQVAGLSGKPVDRLSLIEVGNLVVTHRGAGLLMFIVMATAIAKAGFEWMVFTVTDEVERLIRRLDFNPRYLAMADPARLKDRKKQWGHYYDCNPKVMVGSLIEVKTLASQRPALNRLVEHYHQEISDIAQTLRDIRRVSQQEYL